MWAVDAFAAVVPTTDPPVFAKDLPQPAWEGALAGLGIAANPWLEGIRQDWFSLASRRSAAAGRRWSPPPTDRR